MKAWAIKRKDGLYLSNYCVFDEDDIFRPDFTDDLRMAQIKLTKFLANRTIMVCGIKDCKPVKVRIEEVEE